MQLFIDSADPNEIKTAWDWGIIDGVTTNPSLASKVGKPYPEIIQEILGIVDENTSVSLEVIATDYEGMLEQARKLASIDERVVVKLPCTTAGLQATKELGKEGILVNMTLVFSPAQALLAAKAGAFYISPFVGRLDDIEEHSGDDTLEEILTIMDNYDFESAVLYSSVRDVAHVQHAARVGADAATVPFDVLGKLVQHSLTDAGLTKFLADWEASGLSLPA
jgi:transaldolase